MTPASRPVVAFVVGARGIGGAELWVRNFLSAVDPAQFDIRVLTPDWPALRELVAVDGVTLAPPVAVREPGSRESRDESDAGKELPLTAVGRIGRSRAGARVRAPVQATLRMAFARANRGAFRSALGAMSPDVVHVNNGGYPGASSALAAILAAADLSVWARLMTVHGMPVARSVPLLERTLDRQIATATGALVTVSEASASAFVGLREMPAAKVVAIPTGIPAPPPDRPQEQARAALGLPADAPLAGMLARFSTDKDHATLLDAFAIVRQRKPEASLVLGGDGPLLDSVRDQAVKLGLVDAVVFAGHVEPFTLLRAVDVCVLASRREAMPLSLIEAMSQERPAIATRTGGVPEVVIDGETGYLVAPSNSLELADRLVEVLGDPALRTRLGRAGRARYEAHHTVSAMVESYERLWRRLMSRQ